MKKTVNILASILILQVVLSFWLHVKESNLETFVADQELIGKDFKQLSSIKLLGKKEGDKPSEKLELRLKDNTWQVVYTEANQEALVPADKSKIDATLQALFQQKKPWPSAESQSAWTKLGVADSNYEKQLELSFAGSSTKVIFGSSPSFKKTYARVGEDQNVYNIAFNAQDLSLKQDDWLNKQVLNIDDQQIETVDLPNFKLSKNKDEFLLADQSDQKLDQQAVSSFVRRLAKIDISSIYAANLDSAKAKELDFSKAVLKYELRLKDQSKVIYEMAEIKSDSVNYAVKSSRFNNIYTVTKSVIDNIAKTDKASLFKKNEDKNQESEKVSAEEVNEDLGIKDLGIKDEQKENLNEGSN